MKDLLSRPVIKNIDVEALKAEFEKKSTAVKETAKKKNVEEGGDEKKVVKKVAKTSKAKKAE